MDKAKGYLSTHNQREASVGIPKCRDNIEASFEPNVNKLLRKKLIFPIKTHRE